VAQIYLVANSLQDYFRQSANPEDLLSQATFLEGVEIFKQSEFSSADLLLYAMGDNGIISCLALEALRSRESRPDNLENLLQKLNNLNPWPRFFALRVLNAWVPGNQTLLGRVFGTIDPSWKNPYTLQFLRDFSQVRLSNGDPVNLFQELSEVSDEHVDFIAELLTGLAISGYAAYLLLVHEEGLHILEIPEGGGKSFRRARVRVRVVPQPEEPAENIEMLREHAQKEMTSQAPVNPVVVRRYREDPSPLVRDNVQGWRTGRLDKVWEGNFDLFPALLDPKFNSIEE
jgi:hypothetical protein